MFLLQMKHFILDFYYQPPYQWKNKGTYGHPGGIVHSLQHAIPTFFLVWFFAANSFIALAVSLVEFLLHYHIDWAKMNINKKMGWTATIHEEFWQFLGLDQLLHQLTYIGITAVVFAN